MNTARRMRRAAAAVVAVASVAAVTGGALLLAAAPAASQPTSDQQQRTDAAQAPGSAGGQLVERGRYLVAAGDCVACHTQPGAMPFSGGRPVKTPFGTVLSANLTPDDATGIGRYDADTFYRALHEGIDREGRHLYPAFPYPYYTRVTREDSDAMFAYLRTVPPAQHAMERNQLPFPFNIRPLVAAWNLLFLDKGTPAPDPARSGEWNRGAYLVQGLGHCEACHTPRNLLGGPKNSQAFHGGRFANWFAPDITPSQRTGIGAWQEDELIQFLRTGRNAHTGASGEMAEVVSFSTSRMTADDVRAIATYLRSLPPAQAQDEAHSAAPPEAQMKAGAAIWRDACAACHREDARGVPTALPPLRGNANLQQEDATTVLHYILAGARHRPTDGAPTPFAMPAFDWKLDDAQIAAVATYARNSWGNQAGAVKPEQVAKLRKEVKEEVKEELAGQTGTASDATAEDMKTPGSATWSRANTDSRDNGTPRAGTSVN